MWRMTVYKFDPLMAIYFMNTPAKFVKYIHLQREMTEFYVIVKNWKQLENLSMGKKKC